VAIFLYTDFGSGDLYVGQVKAVLQERAPSLAAIDLLHDAPSFNARAAAYLLAALAVRIPPKSIVLAVIDPGVGGSRRPVAVHAEGRWYVGPDNGLLSVLAARAAGAETHTIEWRPGMLSATFHGRDLFAPVAGMLATDTVPHGALRRAQGLEVNFGSEDVSEVIYIDHYGNAMTGLRASRIDIARRLRVGARSLRYARVYSDVTPGGAFWYENSLGLVEIAAAGRSAAKALKLRLGQPVRVV
jgi:S-adenosylmethionine hydrolase